jgi:hypothetical protein
MALHIAENFETEAKIIEKLFNFMYDAWKISGKESLTCQHFITN